MIEYVEEFIKINGWLYIRLNAKSNESLFEFSEYVDGIYHTLSEAQELFEEWKKQERIK